MKKIGIITLTPTSNYGGIMQSVALFQYLNSQGHDVFLINKKFFIKSSLKRVLIYILERIPLQNLKGFRKEYKKKLLFSKFYFENVTRVTEEVYTLDEFRHQIKKYDFDAVVVGSDQCWRYSYINDGSYTCYFLDFNMENVKKIAYSASFGSDIWGGVSKEKEVSYLLKNFDAISTREESGINLCKQYFDIDNVEHTLDPTLLFDCDFYNKHIEDVNPSLKKDKLVTTYILDDNVNKKAIVDHILNNLKDKKELIELGKEKSNGLSYDVKEWLNNIKMADYVITDSFHGMVFSLIFNKKFLVIGNERRGLTRFQSLLSLVSLENRLINMNVEDDELINVIFENIDYAKVNDVLDVERKKSQQFLMKSLIG